MIAQFVSRMFYNVQLVTLAFYALCYCCTDIIVIDLMRLLHILEV